MKKHFLSTAATLLIVSGFASTSFAHEMMPDEWYVGVSPNFNKIQKIGGAKSSSNFGFDVKMGCHIKDNVRLEGAFTHYFKPKLKRNYTQDLKFTADGDATKHELNYRNKLNLNTFTLNMKVDFDMSAFDLYAGLRAGVARSKNNISITITDKGADGNATNDVAVTSKPKSKNKWNFTTGIFVGAAMEVQDNMFIEGEFGYNRLGKASFMVTKLDETLANTDFATQSVTKKRNINALNFSIGARFHM